MYAWSTSQSAEALSGALEVFWGKRAFLHLVGYLILFLISRCFHFFAHPLLVVFHRCWPGSLYLLLKNSTRLFNNSFHSLTCFSILLIAVWGRPDTNIQVNYSETNLTLCISSMSLLSFNKSVGSDKIGNIFCTNFCLPLVAGNV